MEEEPPKMLTTIMKCHHAQKQTTGKWTPKFEDALELSKMPSEC